MAISLKTKKTTSPNKLSAVDNLKELSAGYLRRIVEIENKKSALRAKHQQAFEEMDRLDAAAEDERQRLKAILNVKETPDFLPTGARSFCFAKEGDMAVVATYVHRSPFYVPEQLPLNVLRAAAIEVDFDVVQDFVLRGKLTREDQKKIDEAYRPATFKHVSVSVSAKKG